MQYKNYFINWMQHLEKDKLEWRKIISLLLLVVILIIPAIHKISDQIPANWFMNKFNDSLIGKVPGGVSFSYFFIILLEFAGPLLFSIGLFQMVRKKKSKLFIAFGFLNCYILFLTLTFGSFLVMDYDNGFKDFIYFIGIMLLEARYFSKD
jgi:hypothetical protein